MNASTQRALALAAGLVLLTGSIILLALSTMNWTGLTADLEVARAQEGRPPAADPARYLVAGTSRAEATADLQARLSDAASAAGIELSSFRFAPADENSPLHLTVDVEAQGDMIGLGRFLHQVESSLPALIISRTRIAPGSADDRLRLEVRIEAQRSPRGDS
tara:strand:+ start:2856 stop:3341 length:486 start_codon:yes stop_codon:yes gene_type:complete